jgi:transcriptional regulator with XRE-family HTH domain
MNSIGEYLRRVREEKKIPIAQVARDTKINERYILALEEGDYSSLPAPTYAKGFLKIYAEYLGIDPKPLIDQFMREHVGISKQVFSIEGDTIAADMASHPWRFTVLGMSAAIVVIIVVLFSLGSWRSCSRVPVKLPVKDTEELEILPLPPIPPVSEPVEKKLPAEEVKEKKKKLVAKAKGDDVWMKVYADGVLLFQGTIPKGKEEFWHAKERFHVRVGRPDALELLLDGKMISNLRGSKSRNLIIDKDGNVTFYKGKMREEQ